MDSEANFGSKVAVDLEHDVIYGKDEFLPEKMASLPVPESCNLNGRAGYGWRRMDRSAARRPTWSQCPSFTRCPVHTVSFLELHIYLNI